MDCVTIDYFRLLFTISVLFEFKLIFCRTACNYLFIACVSVSILWSMTLTELRVYTGRWGEHMCTKTIHYYTLFVVYTVLCGSYLQQTSPNNGIPRYCCCNLRPKYVIKL